MHLNQQFASLSIEQQHSAVLSCCERLVAALRAGSVSNLGSLRMELSGLLHANLAREEAEINVPIRRFPAAERPRLFNQLAEEAAELRDAYSAHVGRWTLASLQRDRPRYSADVHSLIEKVTAHLTKKGEMLGEWRAFLLADQS